jgi:hypothetical protein
MSPQFVGLTSLPLEKVLSLLRRKAAFREGGPFAFARERRSVRRSREHLGPGTTVAGVDERFLHWLLFGLIMATLVSGAMATGTALMTVF